MSQAVLEVQKETVIIPEIKPILEVKNVTKLYGLNKQQAVRLLKEGHDKEAVYKKASVTVALNNVSFEVRKGEIFVLIGLSGSGKSTIVRCLNMLQRPTGGSILFEGQDIGKFNKRQLREYRRQKISMVFQSFGLMSHRDVFGNVSYGLEVRGIPKEERENIANEMISMVGLEGWEHQPITNLSGGMRQRVGIARALANHPEVLLMDEPFSALDPLVRQDMQFELLSIQKKLDQTIVFITHDINEAFKLGDRVAIMRDGRILQIDTPERMLVKPANEYVKNFIDGVDKTQILSARNIMKTPTSIVRVNEGPNHAIGEMRASGVSSVYVVGDKLKLVGLVTLDDALRSKKGETVLQDIIIKDIPCVKPDTSIADLIPIAAVTKFPLAVVDDAGVLKGIITKAAVLSLLA